MQTDIPELVLGNPALSAALTVVVLALVHYQSGLSYREFRAIHIVRCRVFALLNSWARKRGRPLVATAAPPGESSAFVMHVGDTPRAVARRITDVFGPHLVATVKRRETAEGWQWAHSQWVQKHGDGLQTEVFLFAAPGIGTAVYAHVETSVTDPEGHITDAVRPGDGRGAFKTAFDT